MEIGVQTKGIIEPGCNIEEGFRLIASAGFTKVDFNLDVYLKNSDIYNGKLNSFFDLEEEKLREYFSRHKRAMELCRISPSQMHAPYPVRVPGRDEISAYMKEIVIPKSIKIAELLEVPCMVIHPFKMQYTHGVGVEFAENVAYFCELIPMLKEHRVKVCFENLYESVGGRIVEGICSNPRTAMNLIDTLNNEAGEEIFGFCLDTGHLQLTKRDIYEFIVTLGNRIKILHIHENNGIDDIHQIPYTYGRIAGGLQDWDGMEQALAEIEYNGTLNFETFPSINAFPYAMRGEVLKVIHAIGKSMEKSIEGKHLQK